MQQELPGQISIEDFFSTTIKIHPKPLWIKTSIEKPWCPYCNRARNFNRDKFLGVRKCEGCGVSIHEYNVKKHNKFEVFGINHHKKNRKRN